MERVEDYIKKINSKISYEIKLAFVSAIIFGLIAHIYMFTNKLPNYDDLRTLDGFGTTFRSGRWFLWVLGAVAWHLNFVFSLPWVSGLVSLTFLGCAAGLIVHMLGLKNKINIFLISGILVVFPSWTSTFFFMFVAPYFSIALFMMVLAVYLSIQNPLISKIIGIVVMACSLGIYQAYLPFGASLYVLLLILQLYDTKKNSFSILKIAIEYLVYLIAGVVIYFAITKTSLIITGQTLSTYKGISSMGSFELSRIPDIIRIIIRNLYGIFATNELELSYNYITKGMYLIFELSGILCLVQLIKKFIRAREIQKCILTIVLAAAFWIAVNGIFIMCAEGIYSLMYYSYSFLLIMPVCAIEKNFEWDRSRLNICIEWITSIMLFIGVASYCQFANAQYLSLELSYEQATSWCTTLITQIKSVDGYSDELPVAFVGSDINDSTLYRNDVMSVFLMSGRDETLVEAYSREYLMRYYCGFEPEYVSADNLDIVSINKMPTYPSEGSISIVDNVVVIKFSDEN